MKNIIRLLDSLARKNVVGTLTLGQKHRRFEVFIEGDLLYLTRSQFIEKIDIQSLIETGILGQKVTVTTLDTINIGTDLSQSILPEALHSRGLIDESEFRQLIVRHLQEEFFARMQIYQDSFHFQDTYVPDCVVGGEGITVRNPLQLKPFLELVHERAKRIVEIRDLVPSEDEVFVITEKGMAKKQESQWGVGYQKIFDLIDGFRSLRSIIDDGHLFPYYVEGRVFDALQEGWIKKTLMPEFRDVDPETLSANLANKYVPLYKNAINYGVDELTAREGLATLLQKLGNHDEAVIQYNFIGDTLYQMGRKVPAIRAYQKGLALRPDDPLISEKVTRIHLEEANARAEREDFDGAVSLLRETLQFQPDNTEALGRLLEILAVSERSNEIPDLCDQAIGTSRAKSDPALAIDFLGLVIKRFPAKASFHKKLINLFFDFKMNQEALDQMERLALLYLSSEKAETGRELIDKILRMDPARKHLKKHSRSNGSRRRRGSSRGPSRAAVKVVLLAILVLCGYQWWTYHKLSPVRAQHYLAQADADWVQRPQHHKIFSSNLEKRINALSERAIEFEKEFPLSVFRFEARLLRDEFTAAVHRLKSEREDHKKEILARGVKFINRGEISRAHIELAPLLRCKEQDPWRSKAEEALSRAQHYDKSARELRRQIDFLRHNGEWEKCFERVATLLQKYSLSRATRGVKFPVVVHSIPPGAKVVTPNSQGETPFVIELSPREKMQFEISLPGFDSETFTLRSSDGPKKLVPLLQQARWRNEGIEFQTEMPVVQNESVFAVSRDGDLYAFDASSGTQLWKFEMPSVIQAVGAPTGVEEFLVLPLNDGRIVRFDTRTGRRHTFKVRGLLSTAPTVSGDNTTLIFGTSKNVLVEYSPRSNTVVARMDIDKNPPQRLSRGEGFSVLGLDESNRIFRADVRKGSLDWSTRVDTKVDEGPFLATKDSTRAVVIMTKGKKLLGFDFATGKSLWTQYLPEVDYAFLPSSRQILTIQESGEMRYVDLATGKPSGDALTSALPRESIERIIDCPAGIGLLHHNGVFSLHDRRTFETIWTYLNRPSEASTFYAGGDQAVLIDNKGHIAAFSIQEPGEEGQEGTIEEDRTPRESSDSED